MSEVSEHVSKVSQRRQHLPKEDKVDVATTKQAGWVTVRVPRWNKIRVNAVNFTLT